MPTMTIVVAAHIQPLAEERGALGARYIISPPTKATTTINT